MQLTPTYNLKKPEGTDPVDIQDFNDNADIIDAELKKRPLAAGGDVSEMTVKTLDQLTTEFPIPEAGEKSKTFLGKIRKFFEDTKNWMTGVCLIGSIVNNCVMDNAKLPLSAAQGKALMDLYTVLNTKIADMSNLSKDYPPKLHLYNLGDECEDVTGGWVAFNHRDYGGTALKNDDNLFVQTTIAYGGKGFKTTKSVDITDYTMAYVLTDTVASTNVGLWNTPNISGESGTPGLIKTLKPGDNYIGDLAGSVYFAFTCMNSTVATNTNGKLYALYLIK